MSFQIRIQTVDGDVLYVPFKEPYVTVGDCVIVINKVVICSEYFPEYRLTDLEFSIVGVFDDSEVN